METIETKDTGLQNKVVKPITFEVKFFDGQGGICFFDDEKSMGGNGKCIDSQNGGSQTFTVNQTLGSKSVVVTGSAPAGGKITVEVKDEQGTVLTPANKNVFTQSIINSFIKTYIVK